MWKVVGQGAFISWLKYQVQISHATVSLNANNRSFKSSFACMCNFLLVRYATKKFLHKFCERKTTIKRVWHLLGTRDRQAGACCRWAGAGGRSRWSRRSPGGGAGSTSPPYRHLKQQQQHRSRGGRGAQCRYIFPMRGFWYFVFLICHVLLILSCQISWDSPLWS